MSTTEKIGEKMIRCFEFKMLAENELLVICYFFISLMIKSARDDLNFFQYMLTRTKMTTMDHIEFANMCTVHMRPMMMCIDCTTRAHTNEILVHR